MSEKFLNEVFSKLRKYKDYATLENVIDTLITRGYPKDIINKLLYHNNLCNFIR